MLLNLNTLYYKIWKNLKTKSRPVPRISEKDSQSVICLSYRNIYSSVFSFFGVRFSVNLNWNYCIFCYCHLQYIVIILDFPISDNHIFTLFDKWWFFISEYVSIEAISSLLFPGRRHQILLIWQFSLLIERSRRTTLLLYRINPKKTRKKIQHYDWTYYIWLNERTNN